MISKNKRIYAMQFKVKEDFLENLEQILDFSKRCIKDSIICTADLCLTGFAFDRLEEASGFSTYALKKYQEHIQGRTLVTSLIEKIDGKFYNNIKVIKDGKILYSQPKTCAFPLNHEAKYMTQGRNEEIGFFNIDGIKCATLNCFELRMVNLWEKIRGAEIIFIIAQWDRERKKHFEVLSRALAIINQAFVVATDWAGIGSFRGGLIVTPSGQLYRDGKRGVICQNLNMDEIKEARNTIRSGLEDD